MKKVIILMALCLLISGCKQKIYTEIPKGTHVMVNYENIEIYSDIYLHDLINISSAEITSKNKLLNTKKLGTKSYKIYYKIGKKKYVYELKTEVTDSTPPKILGSSIKTIEVNYEDDLCNLVMYGDNHDKNPDCSIIGKYDINKTGSYDLKYIITDSSKNASEFNLTLNVIEKTNDKKTPTTSTKLQFNDVLNKYKNDNNEIGIDVSRWQENIDFNEVKKAGATFVMMRIGSQKEVEGDILLDAYYLQNIKNAKKAGLRVGVYLYSTATSEKESIEQANWVIGKLDGETLDLPIVFDWENWESWNSYNLSFYDINSIADSFIETINKSEYKGMLYSSKYYLENIWENKNNHPVWLAHYTHETTYKGNYSIWQLSNTGKIPGIAGDVDINILYNK